MTGQSKTRLKAEQELAAEKERLAVTLANIGEAVITVDRESRITLMNPVAEKLTGWKAEDALGRPLADVVQILNQYSLQPTLTPVSAVVETRQTIRLADDPIMVSKDGMEWIVSCSGSPIHDTSGSVSGVVLLFRDITHEKMSEDIQRATAESLWATNCELEAIRRELVELNSSLEQKVEERTAEVQRLVSLKDQFIRQLGHDLKTPLTPLLGLLPLIRKQTTDEKICGMLDVVIRNSKYIKDLVDKTLAHARVNSPSAELNMATIDLKHMLDTLIEDNSYFYKEHNITVSHTLSEPVFVRAEPLLLREVFDNLLSNAAKYSGDNATAVVSAELEDSMVHVSVRDNGIGMNEEAIVRIFDEFYKVDDSRHDLASSGLGLPICRRIVEKHGGKIWAESPGIGYGSVIHFTLKPLESEQRKAA